jgi:GNS1/SUR4 family
MSVIMEQAAELYNYLFVTLKGLQPDRGKTFVNALKSHFPTDPRLENYYLTRDSPMPVVTIFISYILLCKYGPKLMESQKPFNLKYVMIAYNLLQVFGNLYFITEVRCGI